MDTNFVVDYVYIKKYTIAYTFVDGQYLLNIYDLFFVFGGPSYSQRLLDSSFLASFTTITDPGDLMSLYITAKQFIEIFYKLIPLPPPTEPQMGPDEMEPWHERMPLPQLCATALIEAIHSTPSGALPKVIVD